MYSISSRLAKSATALAGISATTMFKLSNAPRLLPPFELIALSCACVGVPLV
jgi:hypothetical protein